MAKYINDIKLNDVDKEWIFTNIKPLMQKDDMIKVREMLQVLKEDLSSAGKRVQQFILENIGEELYFQKSDEILYEEFAITGLKNINIPQNIKTINAGAFMGCPFLNYISIPKTVKHIEADAFSVCESLQKVKIEDRSDKIIIERNAFDDDYCEIYAPENTIVIMHADNFDDFKGSIKYY